MGSKNRISPEGNRQRMISELVYQFSTIDKATIIENYAMSQIELVLRATSRADWKSFCKADAANGNGQSSMNQYIDTRRALSVSLVTFATVLWDPSL